MRIYPRYLPAKLFSLVAILSFVIGAALNFDRVPTFSFMDPLFWLFLPRTIPIAVGLIAASFALIYFEVEKRSHLAPSPVFAIAHLITFLLAVVGHVEGIREWTRYLDGDQLDSAGISVCPYELVVFAGFTSIVLFVFSLTRRARTRVSPA